jgi:3-hydroxyacyl-[acyl-carrier-protein] dehydratase
MLKNDFYTISKFNRLENKRTGIFKLNASHAIFEGHFPDIPIVPGVVLLQMVKEVLEEDFACKLTLIEAKNVKFLDFINPKEITALDFEILIKSEETESLNIQARINSKKANHFKLSANYKPMKD